MEETHREDPHTPLPSEPGSTGKPPPSPDAIAQALLDIMLTARPETPAKELQAAMAAKQAVNTLLRQPIGSCGTPLLDSVIAGLLSTTNTRSEWCKRQGIRLLPLTATTTQRTKDAVTRIMHHLAEAHDNKKTASASRGALSRIVTDKGTPAMLEIVACANEHSYDGPHLINTINDWTMKARDSLRALPIDPINWQSVLDSMEDHRPGGPLTDTANAIHHWSDSTAIPGSITHANVTSWNINGFRRAMRAGHLRSFLLEENPDVLFLSEVKCALASIGRPWELRHALAALGYKHVYWNACSIEAMKGNWGCALISKIKPISIRVGMGDDNADPQGRTITARFTDATIIGTYSPCSKMDEGESDARIAYDAAMRTHHTAEIHAQPTFGIGDYNVAPNSKDSTLQRFQQQSCPSTKPSERRAHARLLTSAGLDDAYVRLLPPHADPGFTWAANIAAGKRLFGREWRMRIDHSLAPTNRIGPGTQDGHPRVAAVQIIPNKHGSDHSAMSTIFSSTGTYTIPPHQATPTPPPGAAPAAPTDPSHSDKRQPYTKQPMGTKQSLSDIMDALPILPDVEQTLLCAILQMSIDTPYCVDSLLTKDTDSKDVYHKDTYHDETVPTNPLSLLVDPVSPTAPPLPAPDTRPGPGGSHCFTPDDFTPATKVMPTVSLNVGWKDNAEAMSCTFDSGAGPNAMSVQDALNRGATILKTAGTKHDCKLLMADGSLSRPQYWCRLPFRVADGLSVTVPGSYCPKCRAPS